MKDINNFLNILKIINRHGFEAYLVGGIVRDYLLGHPINDCDITTNARPEQLKDIFKHHKIIDIGQKMGTLKILVDKEWVEITPFRKEGAYLKHRFPSQIKFSNNLQDDLIRRDFTINALCMDYHQNIIDHHQGLYDLKHKVIRAIGNPEKRFSEDALRILRGLRFSAKLNFDIEENTKNALFKSKDLINDISIERKIDELDKIINSKHCLNILKEYQDIFKTFIKLKNLDDNINKLNNDEFYAYTINNLELLKKLKFSNQRIIKIKALKNALDINFNHDDTFIEHLNLNKHLKDILDFKSKLDNFNYHHKYQQLSFRIVEKLAINGNDLLNLGYCQKNIKIIQNKLIKLINQNKLINDREAIIKYLQP